VVWCWGVVTNGVVLEVVINGVVLGVVTNGVVLGGRN